MIYNSTVTAVNESEVMSLLESVEDRFQEYTMAEATAIIVGEQETNWTRFMQGIGLSELNTIMEGQEVIYEGARMQAFVKKAKGFFESVKQKLAELTKSFVAKFMQIVRGNDAFIKKYKKDLESMSVPSDFEYKGYNFKNEHLDKAPDYSNGQVKTLPTYSASTAENILAGKEQYNREAAENAVFKGNAPSGESLTDKLTEYFYGSKEKKTLAINPKDQVKILETTKDLKKKATESYKNAARDISKIIKELDKAEKEFRGSDNKPEIGKSAKIESAFNLLLNYWKAYGSAASQMHGAYMRALGSRNKQAKAICTKLIIASGKKKAVKENTEEHVSEGFVNTDAFLGAVEFI